LRARFRPVAVKQVKVDIGTSGLELFRVHRKQDNLCVAIAEGDKDEAIQNSTGCDDEEAESQKCLDPITYGYWYSRRQSNVCRGRDELEPTRFGALGSVGTSLCLGLGQRLVILAPHGENASSGLTLISAGSGVRMEWNGSRS
jgi:hypothetical protein